MEVNVCSSCVGDDDDDDDVVMREDSVCHCGSCLIACCHVEKKDTGKTMPGGTGNEREFIFISECALPPISVTCGISLLHDDAFKANTFILLSLSQMALLQLSILFIL